MCRNGQKCACVCTITHVTQRAGTHTHAATIHFTVEKNRNGFSPLSRFFLRSPRTWNRSNFTDYNFRRCNWRERKTIKILAAILCRVLWFGVLRRRNLNSLKFTRRDFTPWCFNTLTANCYFNFFLVFFFINICLTNCVYIFMRDDLLELRIANKNQLAFQNRLSKCQSQCFACVTYLSTLSFFFYSSTFCLGFLLFRVVCLSFDVHT